MHAPGSKQGQLSYTQSSRLSSSTRENSRVLFVTKMQPAAIA